MYKTSLVITTINKPNKNMRLYDVGCKQKGWDFIVIGDKKTPRNYRLANSVFISYNQRIKNLNFSNICPHNSYARKNIGYLYAIQNNSKVIIETDDDNKPLNNFFSDFKLESYAQTIEKKNDWLNIYNYFVKRKQQNQIWPRGLPLEKVKKEKKEKFLEKNYKKNVVIQSLCNGNPDVDAIFRLLKPDIDKVKFIKDKKYFIAKNTYVPFNSQSTTWFEDAFPLLYLPVTCTFRTTDIWRSLIAQIILNSDNNCILFQSPTVFQKRNAHNLLKDFESEIPVYLKNKKIIEILKKIKFYKGKKNYLKNLLLSYETLVKNKIFRSEELIYLKSWANDYKKVNYR